jgi:Spy/CpxP family protein refolding chaperone
MRMRTRLRLTLIGLGAAAILAALAPSFTAAQDSPAPAAPAQPRLERGLRARLGLSADQVRALDAFRRARADERQAFRGEMAKLRDEMRRLRRDPQADEARIDALIDKRAGLVAGHEKRVFRDRAERDKIFTPEQREKLRTLRSRLGARTRFERGRLGRHWGTRPGLRRLARWRALQSRPFLWRW